MLVFALDLEDVEEVCSCGVDFDEVFVRCWGWGWDFGDFEVEGSLGGWLALILILILTSI